MTEIISRSEKKRQYKQVESLAQEICLLSDKELKNLSVNPVVYEEIQTIRGLKGGAKKRQLKYLAKLLRQGPIDEIYEFLAIKKGSGLQKKRKSHEVERLRDTLINEAMQAHEECRVEQREWLPGWHSPTMDSIVSRFPNLDQQEIRQVVYQYAASHNKMYYRELFRMIRALVDQEERNQTSNS